MLKKSSRIALNQTRSSYKRRLRFELFERRDLMAAAFMNDLDSLDVDQDQTVSPLDVLNIVNDINRGGSRSLVGEVRPEGAPFVDVDGDKSLSPLDALSVINAINRGRSVGLSRVLQDEAGFANEEFIRIGTGQPLGSRFYELKIDATLAPSTSTIGDLFAVYVVDSNVPSQTLLNRGITSSPIFTLTAQSVETTPGLTTFDGQILTIDLSSIAKDTAQLKLQLLNHDTSKVSSVKATPIANTVDPEGVPSTQQDFTRSLVEVGPTANPATLTPALDAQVSISEVQWTSANRFEADVTLVNKGTAIGRDTVVVLKGLPPSVTVENASGSTAAGVPYLNFRTAIAAGGLGRNESSYSVRLKINNPNNVPFSITPEVLTGSVNRAPTLPPIADLTVMPGGKLSVKLAGQDPDGDTIRYSINSDSVMPTTRLAVDELLFSPTPAQIGNYQFEITASDGALSVSQTVRLAVTADSNTTTRLSGKIFDVSGAPIVGVRVEVGSQQALTQSDGSFLLNFGNALPTGDTLRVRAELLANSRYPFIAEKLGLLLEHDIYAGYNNQILRPVYLPVVNAGTTINPAVNQTITQQLVPNEAPAAVTVRAGTLFTQQGTPFTGALSITEVPPERTPVSLPKALEGTTIVTIQPGDMSFSVPTPITLPNRGKYAPGSDMDIWSINPTNGEFEIVGKGKVSTDGARIETVSGGIRFSSWHGAAPPPTIDPEDETKPDDKEPPTCDKNAPTPTLAPPPTIPCSSEVDVYSGNYIEHHTTPSYSSLGVDRSLTVVYNSSRVKSSQVIRFNTNLPTWSDRTGRFGVNGDYIGVTTRIGRNGVWTTLPGSRPVAGSNLDPAVTRIPIGEIGPATRVSAGVQVDTTDLLDGQYFYSLTILARSSISSGQGNSTSSNTVRFNGSGSSPFNLGSFNKISSEGSTYGTGWGIAGLQRLLITKDFNGQENGVIVVDGGGNETYFEKSSPNNYKSPVGDYSVMTTKPSGIFERRMKDGTIYAFDDKLRLATVTDRNGNQTRYAYDSLNRLVSSTDPVGLVTTLQYGSFGLSSITLPDGRKTFFTVNSRGDLEQIVDPDGSIRNFGYDDDHRLIEEITPLGFTEKTEYDNFSRVRKVTKADGSIMQFSPAELQGVLDTSVSTTLVTSLPATTETSTQIVTTSGNVVTNRVNRDGQIISTKDSLGTRATYEYNDKLQLTKTTDSKGVVTNYAQDALANISRITDQATTNQIEFSDSSVIPTDGLAFNARITKGLDGIFFLGSGEATGDTNLDVIAVGYKYEAGKQIAEIAVFPSDGRGGLLAPIETKLEQIYLGGNGIIGDVNGDHIADVIVTVRKDNRDQIFIFAGQFNGSFVQQSTIDLGGLHKLRLIRERLLEISMRTDCSI